MKKNTVTGFLLLAISLAGFTAFAQTPEQRAYISRQYDHQKIDELKTRLKEKSEKSYKRALELAEQNGWPLTVKQEDGTYAVLTGVMPDDTPMYKGPDNDGPSGSARTSRADLVRTGGSMGLDLNGQNMVLGMWEVGDVMTSHIDFEDKITVQDNAFFTSHDDNNGHATHVAGTLVGLGESTPNARGIAYEAELWAFDSQNDVFEAATAAESGLLISNHSYGLRIELFEDDPWVKGAYIGEAADWDEIMFEMPYYLAVISAGNDRVGSTYDLLLGNKNSKNALVVAAVQAVPNYVNEGSVTMSSFSSWGPTDDYRIKPDISNKGVSVISSYSADNDDNQCNTCTRSLQGTSMAAPGTAGALALIQQHHFELYDVYMKAATLRGLVINTADEAGISDGPDFRFGWGLLNTAKAVEMVTGKGISSVIDELSLAQGQVYEKTVIATGEEDLKVTICWNDMPGTVVNSQAQATSASKLINDLDVRVTRNGEEYLPWALNLNLVNSPAIRVDNTRDNVETVEIEMEDVTPGEYVITVSHKGILEDFASQDYSLIVSGVTDELNVGQHELGNVSIYPNPATDIINISLNDLSSTEGKVELYDLQGRAVRSYNSIVEKIDVSSLSSGMYILNIEYDGLTESRKVIVD